MSGFSSRNGQIVAHTITVDGQPLEEFMREFQIVDSLRHRVQIRFLVFENVSGVALENQGHVEEQHRVVRCHMLGFQQR